MPEAFLGQRPVGGVRVDHGGQRLRGRVPHRGWMLFVGDRADEEKAGVMVTPAVFSPPENVFFLVVTIWPYEADRRKPPLAETVSILDSSFGWNDIGTGFPALRVQRDARGNDIVGQNATAQMGIQLVRESRMSDLAASRSTVSIRSLILSVVRLSSSRTRWS